VLFNIAAVIGIRWLAAAAHTGPVSITMWLLAAGFFFIPSALAVATLSARFPEEGGIYVWTNRVRRLAWLPLRLVLLAQQSLLFPQPDTGRRGYGRLRAGPLRSQDLCHLSFPADPLAGTAD
jgi:hypothetical protein